MKKLLVAMLILAAGMAAWLVFTPVKGAGTATTKTPSAPAAEIVEINSATDKLPKNAPVVQAFIGDLQRKGINGLRGQSLLPFVVGDTLKLEAEARNAAEYLWTINTEIIADDGRDWSPRPDREFELHKPGKYAVTLQVRAADKLTVSPPKQTELEIPPLKILSFEKAITQLDDRFITGHEINLTVNMVQPLAGDLDFYQFRYFVNDLPVKHPDDGLEWTHLDTFSYIFPKAGSYRFKVEAKRTSEPAAEGALELPEGVIVGDAILLSFDASPDKEKGVPVGGAVELSSFPTSRLGKSECRFGVKKINATDFEWLTEENAQIWGGPFRKWIPIEAGTYLVRCEVRELGKENFDDYREIYYTVTDGNF